MEGGEAESECWAAARGRGWRSAEGRGLSVTMTADRQRGRVALARRGEGGDESRDGREIEGGEERWEDREARWREKENESRSVEGRREREGREGERERGRRRERVTGAAEEKERERWQSRLARHSRAAAGSLLVNWSTVSCQLYFPLLGVRRFFAEQPGPAWYYSDMSFSRSFSLSSIPLPLLASIYRLHEPIPLYPWFCQACLRSQRSCAARDVIT